MPAIISDGDLALFDEEKTTLPKFLLKQSIEIRPKGRSGYNGYTKKMKKVYITGHSLGGALAVLALA